MIVLDTPIIIYPDTYDAQFFVRCEVELRSQTVTLYLAPARSDNQNIYLGVKETVDGELHMRFPELLRTVVIQQNMQDPDPVIQDLLKKYVAFLADVEQIIVDNQHEPGGIATAPHQIGTTQWSLQSTWTTNSGREVGIEDITPPPEEGGEDA